MLSDPRRSNITRLTEVAAMHEAKELVVAEPNRIPDYTIEKDIIEKLKRIFYFAKCMAKTVAPEVVLQRSAWET